MLVVCPAPDPSKNEFTTLLNQLIDVVEEERRSHRSVNQLAYAASLNFGYLHHLLRGEKTNPSRDVVIRLVVAIMFPSAAQVHQFYGELNRLLDALDYAPITRP